MLCMDILATNELGCVYCYALQIHVELSTKSVCKKIGQDCVWR